MASGLGWQGSFSYIALHLALTIHKIFKLRITTVYYKIQKTW